MKRTILIFVICLSASVSASAQEVTRSARELAETQLLAEWVGSPADQYKLGNAYYRGEGVPRDYMQAVKWYRKAADQDMPEAQYMMGVTYDRGEGLPQDFAEAVAWYRKAAGQGYVAAQFELGNKYANGEGVPQNFSEAYVWFSLAAAAGHETAREERDEYAAKLSREELISAQQRAKQFFEGVNKE
jgi:TPR repeat protein